jgi:glycosyltransferase involved in cell wall biosynthesis
MKLLLIVMNERRALIDQLYTEISRGFDECDIRRLEPDEQDDLATYFSKHVDIERYDRIAFMIRFKKIKKQTAFLQTIKNLVFIEFDNWQNYAQVKNGGAFSRLYRTVPWCKVLATGYVVSRKLAAEGFDTEFAPKGYDHTVLRNLGHERPIELGFVGSTHNSIYKERVKLLKQISAREKLDVDFVESSALYLEKLNSIRFFLAPDKGFGEYMIKVFEAMACGCILVAYDQGEEENTAVGFKDMVNVVLFKEVDELFAKLDLLRKNTALADQIALAGEHLVRENNTFVKWGKRIADQVKLPMRERVLPQSFFQRLFNFKAG